MGWGLAKSARASGGLSLVFTCFALAAAPWVQAAEPLAEGAHFSAEPRALYALASEPHARGGTSVDVIEFNETYAFNADGTYVYTRYFLYKVVTGAGTGRWDSMAMNWSPWLDEKPTMKARVVLADGSVYTLDEATIADSPAHVGSSLIYSEARTLRAPLPAIAPGAVVETEITRRSRPPFAGAGAVVRSYARPNEPMKHFRLTLQAPKTVPLRYRLYLLPGLVPKHTEEDTVDRWVFDSGPAPAPGNSIAGLPGDVYDYPAITFSTGNSWGELARAYSQITESRQGAADVSGLVARLTKGRRSREEKIEAVIDYLNREIRYTGVEFDQASFVPHAPAEILSHKYGDCKDKALLLVDMLRAAGIPANLALLNAGTRLDIPEDLPGMGLFDHVIVRVAGDPAIWIDATDQNARLGELPDADNGRWALVIEPGTSALTRVAQARSADNVLYEEREIRLADWGPSHVLQVYRPRGSFESAFRRYADQAKDASKDAWGDYFKAQFGAQQLDRSEHTDAKDFSQPFRQTMEGSSARVATTALNDAVAYIRLDPLFGQLPVELRTREHPDEGNAKTTRLARTRIEDYQLSKPFVMELRYRIVPPAGFEAASLPSDVNLKLGGPATLEERFSKDSEGVVHADLRFDTVERRLKGSEVLTLRDTVVELLQAEAIKIKFDLRAHLLLSQGHARESFQAYRELITQHPNDAIQHLRRADGLLAAGMGEAARKEAELATRLDPKSAFAQRTRAYILQHDLIGRWHAQGADYANAAKAYLAAIALDPQDKSLIGAYAVLLEHNPEGVHYGPGADLKRAIAEYQKLTRRQLADLGLDANFAYDLFYTRDFAGALQAVDTGNDRLLPVVIACNTELHGISAALEEARRVAKSDERLKEALTTASQMTLNLRDYPSTAELLESGASVSTTTSAIVTVPTLRQLHKHEDLQLGNSPEDLYRRMSLAMVLGPRPLDSLIPFESRNARVDQAAFTPEELEHEEQSLRTGVNAINRLGIPADVIEDFLIPGAQIKSSGDDNVGYREIVKPPGAREKVFFVVKEDGEYKLLASGVAAPALALEVLDRAQRNDLTGAAALLNWARELTPSPSGDDPYGGSPFARAWALGQGQKDAHAIIVAAAAILVQFRRSAQRGISLLEQEERAVSGDAERDSVDLALLTGYETLEDLERALSIATTLSERDPGSRRAFSARWDKLRALQRLREADELALTRLKERPADIAALRALEQTSAAQHDYAGAYEWGRKVLASGYSDASDLNELAWVTLFYNRPGGPSLDSALRASQLQPNDAQILHTLGCIYAELEKTGEARQALVRSMELQYLSEPSSDLWYAFGRIAEAYGEKETALTDYARVTPASDSSLEYESTYRLAQARMRHLSGASRGLAAK